MANKQPEQSSGDEARGVGMGLMLCGLALLIFPHVAVMVVWAAWIFYGLGLILLLVGIMGWCIEQSRERNKEQETQPEQQSEQGTAEQLTSRVCKRISQEIRRQGEPR